MSEPEFQPAIQQTLDFYEEQTSETLDQWYDAKRHLDRAESALRTAKDRQKFCQSEYDTLSARLAAHYQEARNAAAQRDTSQDDDPERATATGEVSDTPQETNQGAPHHHITIHHHVEPTAELPALGEGSIDAEFTAVDDSMDAAG